MATDDTTHRVVGRSSGLSHVTFIVSDLDRMELILTRVLGARRVYDSGSETFSLSKERFFLIGADPNATWVAVMAGAEQLPRSYNHVAFQVEAGDLPALRSIVAELGLSIREPRSRVDGEGTSLYFHDDDNHLFELHSGSLAERLTRYRSSPSR